METKQLMLLISVKTDASEDEILNAIKANPRALFQMLLVSDNPIIVARVVDKFNTIQFERVVEFDIVKPKEEKSIWDEEVIQEEDIEDYEEIANNLYSFLLRNNKELRDNEYTFIRDMYSRVADGSIDRISEKQAKWLKGLREKYL